MESQAPAEAQCCMSPAAVGFPVPDIPIWLLSATLWKPQHWAGSTHVARPVAREWETGADGVEGDPVNPFAALYLLTVWEKTIPEEKADCTDYVLEYMNIKSRERFL